MKPIVTPQTNAVFVAEGCYDLPATKCHDPETGESYVETAWELSVEDLKKINETGMIYICVMGNGIQPIRVSTDSFVDEEGSGDNAPCADDQG